MIVLGIDTALAACSAALTRDGDVLARRLDPMTRGHAERLFPMLAEVCAEAGVALKAVDRVAVTVGPGSFTGTRVGLAAARGIALAAGCSAVGVTTLRAVAAGAERPAGLLAVLFDARRGGVYGQVFDKAGEALTAPFAAPLEELAERAAGAGHEELPLFLIGTGAEAGLGALHGRRGGVAMARGYPLPDAGIVARLGATFDPAEAPPAPLYLRPPDAVPTAQMSAFR